MITGIPGWLVDSADVQADDAITDPGPGATGEASNTLNCLRRLLVEVPIPRLAAHLARTTSPVVLGIDTGATTHGLAWIKVLGPSTYRVLDFENAADERTLIGALLAMMGAVKPLVAVENILSSYGPAPFGRDTALACQAVGAVRMICRLLEIPCAPITRPDVLRHLVGRTHGGAKVAREAIIDRWGGRTARQGRKCPECRGRGSTRRVPCEACGATGWAARPNELRRIKLGDLHIWSAIAVAVVAADKGALG